MLSICLIAIPAIIGSAWILFPFLEARGLGYSAWHMACILGLLISGLGIACWIAERLGGVETPSWFALLGLSTLGIGAISLRIFGDFYWAFDRGYFLD